MAALWQAAGPMDYFRLDYRFEPETGRRIFLEFNICCHIGRSGAICLAASQWGLSQTDLLGHVIEYSLRRQAGAARVHSDADKLPQHFRNRSTFPPLIDD